MLLQITVIQHRVHAERPRASKKKLRANLAKPQLQALPIVGSISAAFSSPVYVPYNLSKQKV